MAQSLVRAACLTHYAEVARDSGLNPLRMLLDVQLGPHVLDEPDLMIPVDKVGRLLQDSASQSGNESFGLCMASSRLLSNLGPVGLLIRDQQTLRDSLQLLVRYLATLNSALSVVIEEHGDTVVVRERLLSGRAGEPTRQRVELAMGVMVRVIRQLIGRDWQPQRVYFEHDAPRDARMHTKLFGPRMVFNQEFNGIVCTRADLDTRNEFADPAMIRYAQKLLDFAPPCILDDVRRTILLLLPSGRCNIEQVGEHMGVVPRTIQRRLTEKGQTFSCAMNDIRKQLALRYVLESKRSLSEIAELLGFTAASSFSRWYQSQFGCSAKASRAKAPVPTLHNSSWRGEMAQAA
jgi:AraC-like DNA-binding protein